VRRGLRFPDGLAGRHGAPRPTPQLPGLAFPTRVFAPEPRRRLTSPGRRPSGQAASAPGGARWSKALPLLCLSHGRSGSASAGSFRALGRRSRVTALHPGLPFRRAARCCRERAASLQSPARNGTHIKKLTKCCRRSLTRNPTAPRSVLICIYLCA